MSATFATPRTRVVRDAFVALLARAASRETQHRLFSAGKSPQSDSQIPAPLVHSSLGGRAHCAWNGPFIRQTEHGQSPCLILALLFIRACRQQGRERRSRNAEILAVPCKQGCVRRQQRPFRDRCLLRCEQRQTFEAFASAAVAPTAALERFRPRHVSSRRREGCELSALSRLR